MEDYKYKDINDKDIYMFDTVVIPLKNGNLTKAIVLGNNTWHQNRLKLKTIPGSRVVEKSPENCCLIEEHPERLRIGDDSL